MKSADNEAKKLVLVVDDSEIIRISMCKVVRDLGYVAAEAEHGGEALEKVAVRLPDLFVLDLIMLKLGGIEVLRQLREEESTSKNQVIVVTASSDLDSAQRTWGLQVIDYVCKPIHSAHVRQRLGKYLGAAAIGS